MKLTISNDATYDTIFDRIMGHEGGFTANPKDRGNWTGGKVGVGELKGTKYGVSAASYPHLDIKNLTRDQCKAIVFEDFYQPLGLDRYCAAMRFQIMDSAYLHGTWNTVKFFQRAVMTKDDGIIGRATLKAAKAMSENDKLLRFNAYRIYFIASLSTFADFGAGWMNRMASNLIYAAEDNTD